MKMVEIMQLVCNRDGISEHHVNINQRKKGKYRMISLVYGIERENKEIVLNDDKSLVLDYKTDYQTVKEENERNEEVN